MMIREDIIPTTIDKLNAQIIAAKMNGTPKGIIQRLMIERDIERERIRQLTTNPIIKKDEPTTEG